MTGQPERELWQAVVALAIRDCRESPSLKIRLAAEHWLRDTRIRIGSLEWICQQLDLETQKVRAWASRVR